MHKLFLLYILLASTVFAQWQKAGTIDVGNTGRTLAHKNSLFAYGRLSGFTINRSTDNGETWTNISSSFPYDVYNMLSRGEDILAITTNVGGNYMIYVSTDNGSSWTERSRFSTITGNGALIQLASDGNVLYAVSNRRSTYRSTDNGQTWPVEILHNNLSKNQNSFAASGNLYVSTLAGAGALVSTDAGQTWAAKNAGSYFINEAYNINGIIYGLSSGSGIYKYDIPSNSWTGLNSGFPNNGLYQTPRNLISSGNTLITVLYGAFTAQFSMFASSNGGTNWTEIALTGLPTIVSTSTNGLMSANPSYLFLYNYGSGGISGMYRSANTLTSAESSGTLNPGDFILDQNYPNPFNPSTKIRFSVPVSPGISRRVTLSIHTLLGEEIAKLVDGEMTAGNHEVTFNASSLPSGVYLYRLNAGEKTIVKQMLLLK